MRRKRDEFWDVRFEEAEQEKDNSSVRAGMSDGESSRIKPDLENSSCRLKTVEDEAWNYKVVKTRQR